MFQRRLSKAMRGGAGSNTRPLGVVDNHAAHVAAVAEVVDARQQLEPLPGPLPSGQ